MSTSKLQRYVSKQLSIHFGGYTIRENIRPDWLAYGDSRLELDFYIEELRVAIEVQGMQHYIFTPFFHGDYSGFEVQVQRDRFKRTSCTEHFTVLYEVSCKSDWLDIFKNLNDLAGNTYREPDPAIPWSEHPAFHNKELRKRLFKLARTVAVCKYDLPDTAEEKWQKLLRLCHENGIPTADAVRLVEVSPNKSYPKCKLCGSRMRQENCRNRNCIGSPLYWSGLN